MIASFPHQLTRQQIDQMRAVNEALDELHWKQALLAKGKRYALQRIDPETGDMLVEFYHPTIEAAVDDAHQSPAGMRFYVVNLETGRKVFWATGKQEVYDERGI